MEDGLKFDENGKVLASNEEALIRLGQGHQYVMIGDTSHATLRLEQFLADDHVAIAANVAGVTQAHMETPNTVQELYDVANADLAGFVENIKAKDFDTVLALANITKFESLSTHKVAAGISEASKSLTAKRNLHFAMAGVQTFASDDKGPIDQFKAQYSEEDVAVFEALNDAFLRYESGVPFSEMQPKNEAERAAIDAWMIVERVQNKEEVNAEEMSKIIELMGKFQEYLQGKLAVRDAQDAALTANIDKACEDTKCLVTWGNGHFNEGHDMDEMLPDSVTIAIYDSVPQAVRELNQELDPNDYAYILGEGEYYHTPTMLEAAAAQNQR